MRAADAVRDLWPLTFGLPTDEGDARRFTALIDLARSVPTWNLYRPMRLDDLPATVEFIVERV